MNERRKKHIADGMAVEQYYWRGIYGEIDLVEHHQGTWQAYEYKWGKDKASVPQAFKELYPTTEVEVVSPATIVDFVV